MPSIPTTEPAPTTGTASAAGTETSRHVEPNSADPAAPAPTTGHGEHRRAAEDRLWAALRQQPGATTTELAATANIGRSTAAKLLAAWAADGSATSTPGATPRVARHWTATPTDATTHDGGSEDSAGPDNAGPEDAGPEGAGLDSAGPGGAARREPVRSPGERTPGSETHPNPARPSDADAGRTAEQHDITQGDINQRDFDQGDDEPIDGGSQIGTEPAPDHSVDDALDDNTSDNTSDDDGTADGDPTGQDRTDSDGAHRLEADLAGAEAATAAENADSSHDDRDSAAPQDATDRGTDRTTALTTAQCEPVVGPGEDGATAEPDPGATQLRWNRRARRLRPGALRGRVEDHLREHPGEHSPTEIGHALGRSSGAIANALEALVDTGTVARTCEAPKRYCHTDHADDIEIGTAAREARPALPRRRGGLGPGVSGVGTWVTVLAVVPLAVTEGADTTDELTAWLRSRLPGPVPFATAAHGVTRAAVTAGAPAAGRTADGVEDDGAGADEAGADDAPATTAGGPGAASDRS